MYVAINHIITAFIFSKFIPKIHCHILFMSKPFGQLVYMHHVSQLNIYIYIYIYICLITGSKSAVHAGPMQKAGICEGHLPCNADVD